jgi:ATP-dependent protease ClpP protease subunit
MDLIKIKDIFLGRFSALSLMILSLAVVLCETMSAQTLLDVRGKNIVYIPDLTIDDNASLPLRTLSDEKVRDFVVIINSGGGSRLYGQFLIDKIKELNSRGVSVSCVVVGSAYSMAMFILDACRARYVQKDATLMFHDLHYVSPSDGLTIEELEKRIVDLKSQQAALKDPLLLNLGVDRDEFNDHARKETIWTPAQLLEWAPDYDMKIIDRLIYSLVEVR